MCGCWAILSKVSFGQNSGQLHCGRRVPQPAARNAVRPNSVSTTSPVFSALDLWFGNWLKSIHGTNNFISVSY